jgi:hypothetical protein
MAPTRAWFTKWSTAMFAVLFAKVPIAILLALSVSLFANSANAGLAQSFANAGAGLILGLGALLSPLLAYGLFSFMGSVAVRPAVPSGSPTRTLGSAYYGSQMGRAGINGVRSVIGKTRDTFTSSPQAAAGSAGSSATAPAPHEPSAADRAHGAPVTTPTPSSPPATPPTSAPATGGPSPSTTNSNSGSGAATGSPRTGSTSGGVGASGSASSASTAATAGAAATGVGAGVLAAQKAKDVASSAKTTVTGTAGSLAGTDKPPSAPPADPAGPYIDPRRTT